MSRFQPALLGGLFIGVVSALPVVGQANLCCCLWVVVGGVLTTYLLQQSRPASVESTEAALSGLLAGALGGLIYVLVLSMLLSGAAGMNMEAGIREAMDRNAQVPPEVRDMVLNLFTGRKLVVLIAVMTVPVYALFGMLGALLGLTFFRKKTPPAGSGADAGLGA